MSKLPPYGDNDGNLSHQAPAAATTQTISPNANYKWLIVLFAISIYLSFGPAFLGLVWRVPDVARVDPWFFDYVTGVKPPFSDWLPDRETHAASRFQVMFFIRMLFGTLTWAFASLKLASLLESERGVRCQTTLTVLGAVSLALLCFGVFSNSFFFDIVCLLTRS